MLLLIASPMVFANPAGGGEETGKVKPEQSASILATAPPPPGPVVCNILYVSADDFVVDVFVNGKPLDDSKRKMMGERFGATSERMNVELHAGDWIVFNVVANRMRWGGSRYFAVEGMTDQGEPAFWTESDTGKWSFCDNPSDVERFIASPAYQATSRVVKITSHKWGEGDKTMKGLTKQWKGEAIWASGASRNIWIKYGVTSPPPPEKPTPPVNSAPPATPANTPPAAGPTTRKGLFDTP